MGGRIDCYFDIASFFSYIAFVDLLANLDKLAAHGVEVEFHPVLIAGINQLSGNKPPWFLPAKQRYLSIDSQRSARRVSKPNLRFPKDFMSMAMTISPQRALHYIKANYPTSTFLSAAHYLMHRFWEPPHVNLTVDENLAKVLSEATETPEGGRKLFTEDDVKAIMEGKKAMKEKLTGETKKVVEELGAFGAPWLYVTNAEGKKQPFFGSDRFNHVYNFLGIPFQDVAILPPSKL